MKTVIDVSKWQGTIDWDRVKASGRVDGVIVKLGSGKSKADSQYVRNIEACIARGIPVGVYLYSYAQTANDCEMEVNHILGAIARYKDKLALGVWIDIEDKMTTKSATLIATTEPRLLAAKGYKVGIYTGQSYYNSYMSSVKSYNIWLARYYKNTGVPCGPVPGVAGCHTSAWQYTSIGRIDGISANVDISQWYDDFNTAAVPAPAAPVSAPKSVDAIVAEVLAGKYGNGVDRKAALVATYGAATAQAVQDAINARYGRPVQKPVHRMTIDEAVAAIVRGDAGNGEARKAWVKAQGLDYAAVQAGVNAYYAKNAGVKRVTTPRTSKVYYTVGPNDTLSGIAARYGTTVRALQRLNGINNPNRIFVGQKIRVR